MFSSSPTPVTMNGIEASAAAAVDDDDDEEDEVVGFPAAKDETA